MTWCMICEAPLFSLVNIWTYSRLSLFTEISLFLSSIELKYAVVFVSIHFNAIELF